MCVLVEEERLKDVANKLAGLVPCFQSGAGISSRLTLLSSREQTKQLTIAGLQSRVWCVCVSVHAAHTHKQPSLLVAVSLGSARRRLNRFVRAMSAAR